MKQWYVHYPNYLYPHEKYSHKSIKKYICFSQLLRCPNFTRKIKRSNISCVDDVLTDFLTQPLVLEGHIYVPVRLK